VEKNSKEPWFAVNLSMVFSGIGQIYSGKVLRGCILIFAQIVLLSLGGWLVFSPTGNAIIGAIFLLSFAVIQVWNLFDAHRCIKKENREDFERTRKEVKDPWLAVFISQILPGIGHLYIKKWLWGIIFFACFISVIITENANLLILTFGSIFSAFVCYHAYISSPVHREGSKRLITILALLILSNIFLDVLIMRNSVQVFKIPTGSMEPTFRRGDRILIKKHIKYVPERGDIIVFKYTEGRNRNFVKRIVAFGGEIIEIKDGNIYVNGNKLESPPFQNIRYIATGKFGGEDESFIVPEHSLFVLGDNSKNSRDSRFFGSVPEEDVIGKVYKICWPPNRMGPIYKSQGMR